MMQRGSISSRFTNSSISIVRVDSNLRGARAMRLTPKNWQSFQHYKDRAPAWIKLHRTILDNADFQRLPVASRALAPMLWLLAAEYDGGAITANEDDVSWRLRMTLPDFRVALQPLLDKGFFSLEISDSKPLADRKRDAIPEKEGEAEAEAEAEGGGVKRARDPEPKQIDLEDAIASAPPKRKSLISEDAHTIAGEVLEAMGKDPFDPLCVGAPLQVQGWLNGGWNRDCVLAGVKLGVQSRQGVAPSTLKYFEKAIARAHAS
jgi:hypothetical protein